MNQLMIDFLHQEVIKVHRTIMDGLYMHINKFFEIVTNFINFPDKYGWLNSEVFLNRHLYKKTQSRKVPGDN